jgi:UDP-N-acetylglucosamine:LPS N-acetylglucosamine transferase
MRRYLILTAGMGDGHLQVAAELRRRLVQRGGAAEVVDILRVLPFNLGPLLRGSYSAVLRHTPWVYEAIYRKFFVPRNGAAMRPDPLVMVSAPAVCRLIEKYRPDVVVSTFHLCGQITGRLRESDRLAVPAVVVVNELVAHQMWTHPGNDAFICLHQSIATEVAARTAKPAFAAAPAVRPEFAATVDVAAARRGVRTQLGIDPQVPVALVSAGAWGSGDIVETVEAIAAPAHVTVVLCGRNERLRRRLSRGARAGEVRALGWRDDLPDVMRASDVLVENAGGQTAMEALAIGLPVLTFRPLPGHGQDDARARFELGLSSFANDPNELLALIGELSAPQSRRRKSQLAAGHALFTTDPVEFLDRSPLLASGPSLRR